MTKYNPFLRFETVTPENFDKIRIERLKGNNRTSNFNVGIDNLIAIKRNLVILQKLGRITESGNHVYFIQAIQWLKGEIALGTWVSVPQVTDLDTIDENTANLFEEYTRNLLSNLRTETLYSQVELMNSIVSTSTSEKIKSDIASSVKDVEEESAKVAEDAIRTVQDSGTAIVANLQDVASSGSDNINAAVKAGISQLQQAQALEDWGLTYDQSIVDIKEKLFGLQFTPCTISSNFNSLWSLVKSIEWRMNIDWRNIIKLPVAISKILIRNLSSTVRVLWSKFISFKFQRIIWFSLLSVFATVFVIMSFAYATGQTSILGINLKNLKNVHDNQWYVKYTVYLPVAFMLGIAYSFSVKNYRIYSNMLDQYLHRRTVAQTSQGIIVSLTGTNNEKIRDSITVAAAQALFEHRNTGHLSKKEAESMSPIDMLKLFGRS